MNKSVSQKKVTVGLTNGLHLRPQSMIVQIAQGFESDVTLSVESHKVDAKSMLDLMTLAATFGTELLLEAAGSDSEVAVKSIGELFESNFEDMGS
jgi:phosphocarrier protein HPr